MLTLEDVRKRVQIQLETRKPQMVESALVLAEALLDDEHIMLALSLVRELSAAIYEQCVGLEALYWPTSREVEDVNR